MSNVPAGAESCLPFTVMFTNLGASAMNVFSSG
jgi:hypothetical protein